MPVLLARYKVHDFATYKAEFDEFAPVRRALGATRHRLMRSPDEPGVVVLLLEFPTLDAARAFVDEPRRLELFDRAGIIERVDLVLVDMDTGSD